jgi:hypothetical protein
MLSPSRHAVACSPSPSINSNALSRCFPLQAMFAAVAATVRAYEAPQPPSNFHTVVRSAATFTSRPLNSRRKSFSGQETKFPYLAE